MVASRSMRRYFFTMDNTSVRYCVDVTKFSMSRVDPVANGKGAPVLNL